MTAPHSTTSTSPDNTTRKIDLNVTQVAAGALAAVTAAVLGSSLGAAGTLIGAAGASAITTVGTAVYRASLERSRERVRALARRTRPLPSPREVPGIERSDSPAADAPLGGEQLTDSTDREPSRRDRSRMLRWGAVVGALGAFALAMMIITGFEWASGESVGGNGEGTTVGKVLKAPSGPRNPNPTVPRGPRSSSEPTSEAPTETTEAPSATTTPDGGGGVDQRRPSRAPGTQEPSEVPTTPPLVPTDLPGFGE